MEFINELKSFSERISHLRENITTEEATKTSTVLPFFQLLGYDVFNPLEFVPEYTADTGTKKGEKVDYAIIRNNDPIMIVEVKPINTDLGKTIKENVSEYLNCSLPHSLKWAVISGNSTKSQDAPGGLGISMLLDFLKLNKGGFTLISDNECLEINQRGERYGLLQSHFPGTIVSITFNMQDNFSYILKGEDNDTIIL